MPLVSDLHVVPQGDLIEHEIRGQGCICGPRLGLVEAAAGRTQWVLVHPSLDGREFRSPPGDPGE